MCIYTVFMILLFFDVFKHQKTCVYTVFMIFVFSHVQSWLDNFHDVFWFLAVSIFQQVYNYDCDKLNIAILYSTCI